MQQPAAPFYDRHGDLRADALSGRPAEPAASSLIDRPRGAGGRPSSGFYGGVVGPDTGTPLGAGRGPFADDHSLAEDSFDDGYGEPDDNGRGLGGGFDVYADFNGVGPRYSALDEEK